MRGRKAARAVSERVRLVPVPVAITDFLMSISHAHHGRIAVVAGHTRRGVAATHPVALLPSLVTLSVA